MLLELLTEYFIATIILSIFLAIFMVVLSTFCTLGIRRIRNKTQRFLVPVLISILAVLLLGFTPLLQLLANPILGPDPGFHTPIIWVIPGIILWPMAFVFPYLVLEDPFPRIKKWSYIFLVSLFLSSTLFITGFICLFSHNYSSVYQVMLLPGMGGFSPKLIGIFLEGCISACGGYGILVLFSTLWETNRNRASDCTSRGSVIIGGIALVLLGIAGWMVTAPDRIGTIICLIFLGIIAGTGITFFFALQRVANKYLRIGIPALLALLFLGTIVIAPLIPSLFFFGDGTMVIIMAGLGAVTLLPLIQERTHTLSVMSALVVTSPAIVLGLIPYGILNSLTRCASMEDRISSEPGLFLAVYLISTVVSVSVCWILVTAMNRIAKRV